MDYQKELEFAKQLAEEAGIIMRRYFQSKDIGTTYKEDKTPLTVADTTINDLVIEKVKESFPNSGVLGEEGSYKNSRKELWVVDPIDGTIPFSLGIPVSTFCLAYTVEGKVLASVVYNPFSDSLYWATKDGGAFLNNEKISVLKIESFNENLISLGNKGLHKTKSLLSDKNSKNFWFYSFAYSAVQVASGNFVASAIPLGTPWDAAAVSLIVEEAGGKASDFNGDIRNYSKHGDGILVSNGILHQELVEMISYEDSRD